jgi:hypothetical protein
MKKLMITLACLLPFNAIANNPAPPTPVIAEVYECTLNDGFSAADIVAFGSNEVSKFTRKNDVQMHAYLWEAIAVNEPYREADVRWVNYYPTWSDYYASNDAFNSKGTKLVEKFYSMVTCNKPVILGSQVLTAELVVAKQKPMVASVCNLKKDKTTADGAAFVSQLIGIANRQQGGNIGASLMTPVFGITGFDYVSTIYGTTDDMAGMMDSVRDRTMPAAMRSAGLAPVADCVNDLHMSHLMIQLGQ